MQDLVAGLLKISTMSFGMPAGAASTFQGLREYPGSTALIGGMPGSKDTGSVVDAPTVISCFD
jgi:hypothetical protein